MKRKHGLSLLITLIAIVCTCMVFVFAGCNCSKKNNGNNSSAITLSQTTLNIVEGKSGTVVATYSGSETIEWEIEDDSIATINAPTPKVCTVTAVKVGTTTLTAKAGEDKATCTVKVTEDNTEKVTITLGGEAVTEADVDMGETITFAATASLGSPITWESSNTNIATVNQNGVVKGEKPGTATITAKVNESIKAEVALTVNSVGGYVYYEITLDNGASDAAANPGVWAYWTEWGQFSALNYDNGTVNIAFTENGGNWYNIQLFNVDSTIDPSKYYKLTVDIDSNEAGRVTINGNVVNLQEGKHTYEVYFVNGNGFSMQFGVENVGLDIFEATVAISNIHYEEDTNRVNLIAPTFTYNEDTCEITINNPNPAGVKHYVLTLYQDGVVKSGVTITGNGVVDWSKVVSGTYDATIKAIAENVHYIDSPESSPAQTINVVNEGGIKYSFHHAPDDPTNDPTDGQGVQAKAQPGIWTYWSENWVTIDGNFENDKLTVTYSNNTGNWYDTQLNYRHPGLTNGQLYDLKLEIDSNAADGRVTLNGNVFTILEGKHVYDIVFVENGGLSIQITFGLDGQNNQQEIPAATMVFEIKDVGIATPTPLQPVTATYSSNDGSIEITDPNEKGVGKYLLGFFAEDGTGDAIKTVEINKNDTVDTSVVIAGKYAIKVKAVGENLLYTDSDWSGIIAVVTSTNENAPLSNGEEHNSYVDPNKWYEWHDQNYNGSTVTVSEAYVDIDGAVHFSFTIAGSNIHNQAAHLYYHYSNLTPGQAYTLTLKLNSSVACTINFCDTEKAVVVGDNNISVNFVHPGENPDWEGKPKGATIRIYFNDSGNFVLSDINVQSVNQTQLQAPSFSIDGSNVITITDSQSGVGSYELGFFESSDLNTPKYTVTVVSGSAIDLSTVEAGTYTVKIRAVAADAGYITSGWSTETAQVISSSTTVEVPFGENQTNNGPGNAVTSPDKLYYWNDQNWCGSYVTVTKKTNAGGVYTFTYSGMTTACTFGFQLFYKNSANVTGNTYKVSFNINATAGGKVLVNEQERTLVVGDNTIEVEYTETQFASLSMQFGTGSGASASVIASGTFVLTNLAFTAV